MALIPDAHEGYIRWDEFQQIQTMIGGNVRSREQSGAAQNGPSLPFGLLRCRRCGRKLTVQYTGRGRNIVHYACHRGWLDSGQPKCIAFGGTAVDAAIGGQILHVVQPAAMESAMLASEEEARRKDEVLQALNRDLDAARYAAQRAHKQFDRAVPDNRLVADELERRWNQALERVRALETRIEEHAADQSRTPVIQLDELMDPATELEAVWKSPEADARLKKRIVRTLIHEIVVGVDADAGEIILVIHWKVESTLNCVSPGGAEVRMAITPRRRSWTRCAFWRGQVPTM